MHKRIRTALITSAVVGGSLFGVTQVAGTVNAQTDDTTVDTEQVQDAPEDGERGRRGPRGEDGDGPRGARGPRGDRGARAEATAELIGIEVDDLRAALQDGQTLAEVAAANGVDPQTIIDAKVDAKAERLATAVEEGNLTEEEAAEKLADVTERITTRVNEGRPDRPDRPADAGTEEG